MLSGGETVTITHIIYDSIGVNLNLQGQEVDQELLRAGETEKTVRVR